MRKMKDLFDANERVRFYIADEWKHDFYEELVSMKACFMNGVEICEDAVGTMMGVGRDGTVGYISNLVWYYSFFSSANVFIRVDYGKYRSGADNYLITTPNIHPAFFKKIGE